MKDILFLIGKTPLKSGKYDSFSFCTWGVGFCILRGVTFASGNKFNAF